MSNEPVTKKKNTHNTPRMERATELPERQTYAEVRQENPGTHFKGTLYIESREDAVRRQRERDHIQKRQVQDNAQHFAQQLEELEE